MVIEKSTVYCGSNIEALEKLKIDSALWRMMLVYTPKCDTKKIESVTEE